MYWYDKPADSRDEPELAFFAAVPTVWDETRVLDGAPGESAVLARRSAGDWFVGAITNNDARQLTLPLSFLAPGATYTACIYTDDDKVKTRTRVAVEKRLADASKTWSFPLKASGGLAIHFIREPSAGNK
jgi:alpha-glucosidase